MFQDDDSMGKDLNMYDNDSNSNASEKIPPLDSTETSKRTSETLQQLYFSSVKEGMGN